MAEAIFKDVAVGEAFNVFFYEKFWLQEWCFSAGNV